MNIREMLKKATPRPWKARDREISGNNLLVGEVYCPNILDNPLPGQPSFEEGQANKHLIIRSANTLEAVLEELTIIATASGPLTASYARSFQTIALRAIRHIKEG